MKISLKKYVRRGGAKSDREEPGKLVGVFGNDGIHEFGRQAGYLNVRPL